MSGIDGRLRKLERGQVPQIVRFIMVFDDEQLVTDDDGSEITAAEWKRRHPEAEQIQLTWGDDTPDNQEVNDGQ